MIIGSASGWLMFGAAPGDLVADELAGHQLGNRGAERFAALFRRAGDFTAEILADRDIFHLRRHDAGLGIGVLRHRLAFLADQGLAAGMVEQRHRTDLARLQPVVLRTDGAAGTLLDVAAVGDPLRPQGGQAGADVDLGGGIGIGAGGVIDPQRRLLGGGIEVDLAECHLDVGEALARDMHLARGWQGAGGNGEAGIDGAFGHAVLLRRYAFAGRPRGCWRSPSGDRFQSLRRHDPDQVQRVSTSLPRGRRWCLSLLARLPLDR
jgi:hypothetical protein